MVTSKKSSVTATAKPVKAALAAPSVAPVVVKSVVAKVIKPAAKKSVVAPAPTPASPAVAAVVEKIVKLKKPKLVRDSFTIPKAEYLVLEELKQRTGKLGSAVKKSELIRAGIKALEVMSDVAFLAALQAVPTIKTGRPSKD